MIFDGESVNMMPFTPLDFEVSYFQTKSTQNGETSQIWASAGMVPFSDWLRAVQVSILDPLVSWGENQDASRCAREPNGLNWGSCLVAPVFAGENHHFTPLSVVSFKRSMHKQSTWFCGATLFLNAKCNSTQLFLLNGNKIMYFFCYNRLLFELCKTVVIFQH